MAHDPGGSDWHFDLLDGLVDAQHRASHRVLHPVCRDDATDLGGGSYADTPTGLETGPTLGRQVYSQAVPLLCVICPLCSYFFVLCRLSHAGLLPLVRIVEDTKQDDAPVEVDGEVQAGPERS